MRPEAAKLLWDAREACRLVLEFAAGRSFDDYEESALLRSAVERQLEIVGEALRRLSRLEPETAARIPELESVVGFRNVSRRRSGRRRLFHLRGAGPREPGRGDRVSRRPPGKQRLRG